MRACKCCAEYGQVLFSFARSILNPLFQRFAVKIETTCAQPLMLVGFLRTSPCCRITWHASVSPTVSMCDPRITSGLPLTSPVFQETHRVRWHDGMKVRDVELSFRFAIQLPSDSPYIFLLCTAFWNIVEPRFYETPILRILRMDRFGIFSYCFLGITKFPIKWNVSSVIFLFSFFSSIAHVTHIRPKAAFFSKLSGRPSFVT